MLWQVNGYNNAYNPTTARELTSIHGEAKGYKTAEDVIKAIYNHTFKGACLIPVKPEYQDILGAACWVCGNERQAARKRMTETCLVFTSEELKLIVNNAMRGRDELRAAVIDTKKTFGGIVGAV